MVGWLVLFVAIAGAALACAMWYDGYAQGMADGTRVLAEWCRRHMGDSKAICGDGTTPTGK